MHFPPSLFSNGMQVEDINLNVGTESDLSESIIKDVKGVSIVIRRSLRDLMHQVPSIEAGIKVMDCVHWYWYIKQEPLRSCCHFYEEKC